MATAVSINHIEITAGTCSGRPRITGHRITVQNIVICYERMGMSPDEIIYYYPSINLADVHAALAYYYDHVSEIRKAIADDEVFAREIKAKYPSLVQEKLRHRDD
jgi:uncharacterized protein (DUF433 family)